MSSGEGSTERVQFSSGGRIPRSLRGRSGRATVPDAQAGSAGLPGVPLREPGRVPGQETARETGPESGLDRGPVTGAEPQPLSEFDPGPETGPGTGPAPETWTG